MPPARTASILVSNPEGSRGMVERVTVTPAALALIEQLRARNGDLLFHQSGGCCDGSAPMCYPRAEFRLGSEDLRLGEIAGCPFYIGAAQFESWAHTQLIVDVVPGRGSGFSLEAPEGIRFLTRGRVFTEAEVAELDRQDPPARAEDPLR
jgi:uncharacterized protein (DUF779 family)